MQLKREQILANESTDPPTANQELDEDDKNSRETWLRELQAKQAERRMKKQGPLDGQDVPKVRAPSRRTSDLMMNCSLSQMMESPGIDVPDCARSVVSSVKDMAARFEQIKVEGDTKSQMLAGNSGTSSPAMMIEETKVETPNTNQSIVNFESTCRNSPNSTTSTQNSGLNAAILSMSLTLPHENGLPVDYPEDDISEVAMQNTIQNTTILPIEEDVAPRITKRRIGKKKSVSFCDQVVLVATAEDDEKDSYIPNPILERVLRSAMNKPETAQVLREIRSLQEAELNRDSNTIKFEQHTLPLKSEADSSPATNFKDQIQRTVNPMENSRTIVNRQNSNEAETKKIHAAYNGETPSPTNQLGKVPISYSPQLQQQQQQQQQQQIRYTQNGYGPYNQQTNYPQTQTSHPRNQTIPLSQTQKPSSPYPNQQIHGQYPQSVVQQAKHKNPYPGYHHYQLEQQHNQMNKQISGQQQIQQNTLNTQRVPSHNPSPITVQHAQQFVYPSNHSPNPYQQYNSGQNQYATYPQQQQQQQGNRTNQPLPQYQPPPNPAGYQQHIQQHNPNQTLQIQQNYQQQRIDNYQRPPQKIEQQNVLAPNQTYPNPVQNGQIQSNMKYPNYQPVGKQQQQQQSKQQIQQFQNSGKCINPTANMQKSASLAGMPRATPCHLCRKKQVVEPATYCTDCDFYMSRFRPKN